MSPSPRTRNYYNTELIFLYKGRCLDEKTKCQIPSSTRWNWDKLEPSKIKGYSVSEKTGAMVDIHKLMLKSDRFYTAVKALLCVNNLLLFMLSQVKAEKKFFDRFKEKIIGCVRYLEKDFSPKQIFRYLPISKQQFDYWVRTKTKCSLSFVGLWLRRHTHQLLEREIRHIKDYVSDQAYKYWPLVSIYFKMIMDQKAFCCLSTFYAYVRYLGLSRRPKKSFDKKHKIGIRASRPLQILHLDVTSFRLPDRTRVYIYLVVDNFSRPILAAKASLELSAEICLENLKSAVEKFKIIDAELFTDEGPENQGSVRKFLSLPETRIIQTIAQKDSEFSNSMVEALNKILKYRYIFEMNPETFEQVVKILEFIVSNYNDRPHGSLSGVTPLESVAGKVADKELYRKKLVDPKKARVEKNKGTVCEVCA